MAKTRDLVIVGGGPAGLATAIEARLAGLDTLVLDGRRPPIDRACGEGLMPGGVCRLKRLGVRLSATDGWIFNGVRYVTAGVSADARFGFSAGVGIRRTTLHRALGARAAELGAELRWGAAVRGLTSHGVTTDRGEVRAHWLVAADGRLSQVRSWAGIATTTPTRARFGRRRHYEIEPWTDLVEVHWGDNAEAYVTPAGPRLVGVAVLTGERPLDFDRIIGGLPQLARRLAGAPTVSDDRGAGPFGQRPARVFDRRLALVGDASGCLDPITGEGLSLAFGQAAAVIAAITAGDLRGYAAEHRRLMRLPSTITRLLLAVERRPGLRRRMIGRCAAWPTLFGRLVGLVGSAGVARKIHE